MTSSPLQFAREFNKLKSDLGSQPADDLKLLRLAQFWPQLEPHRDNPAFRSYVQEYSALFQHLLNPNNLPDLTTEE
ncbi:MAG: hypothetical protein AB1744_16395, partial [Candidatus Zixiibacteriota bacterium]